MWYDKTKCVCENGVMKSEDAVLMDNRKDKLKVLFLCTGNACRSQMAEGWVRHLKSDVIEAYLGSEKGFEV